MDQNAILLALGGIGAAALLSQWLAWRLRLPAILFLLLSGIVAGPLLGWLDPDEMFGPLLFPLVSLAVALILFEGSLTLHFSEWKEIGTVVHRMVTIGALSTWGVIALAAHYLLDFSWEMALLFGTLTLVTGPTVIVPMLRVVRPKAAVANILRWEGIVIDPIGALLAVVVYSFIISSGEGEGWLHSLQTFGGVILCGSLFGILGGWALGIVLRRHWLPDYLHNLATLAAVLGVFIASNRVMHESGLLAVTLMGMGLANMKGVDVRQILHFKENLSVLLISGLFILLAARLDINALLGLGPAALLVLLLIQFVARPLNVALSTWGSPLSWRERALLSWIAPRGIVAAAVSAIFAIRLSAEGHAQAALLVPLTFLVIIGTVVLQSATARPLARLLKVAEPSPSGYLIVGATPVGRAIGAG
ncbi:sodium:proton antiporter, partial [Pseudomonas aeruginosa]|nr:sodium:proton antiporter [Pseudomonas aeruginosa]